MIPAQRIDGNYHHTPPNLTFQGQPMTPLAIFDAITEANSPIRLRGASQEEAPFYTTYPGLVSRGEIRSYEALLKHTTNTIGISTTSDSVVAQRFASDCRTGVIHVFDTRLIPAADRMSVSELMPNDEVAQKEKETVFCNSIPEETYLGYWTGFTLGAVFYANQNYIDPLHLAANPTLRDTFFSEIYYPFVNTIAPAIREKQFSASEKTRYNATKKHFHNHYALFAATNTQTTDFTNSNLTSLTHNSVLSKP